MTVRLGSDARLSAATAANAQKEQMSDEDGYQYIISSRFSAISPLARNVANSMKPVNQATAAAATTIAAYLSKPVSLDREMILRTAPPIPKTALENESAIIKIAQPGLSK
jgi:hypothetical protein